MKKITHAKFLILAVLGLALLGANGNVLLSSRVATAQGIDLAGMDKSVDPGDDFFSYANGGWFKAAQIPADRPSYGAFDVIAEQVRTRTADLIKGASKSNDSEAKKIGDYYDAFMNEEAIEKKGLTPIKAELDEINAIADKTALARVLGSQLRADVDPLNNTNFYTDRLVGIWFSPDLNNPTHNVPYLLQGGLGLPDRDNYLATEKNDVELQTKYREHIVTILKLAEIADAEAKAGRIYDFEKMIATVHATRTDSADIKKANNPWGMKDFSNKAPGLDWTTFFKAAGLSGQPTIVVWHPGAVTGISALAASQSLDVWKEYLTFRAIDRASGLLPKPFATERFKFYSTTLNGIPQQSDRWKRAVKNTSAALGNAVGKLYVKQYFPPEAKAKIQTMVKNIVTAFGKRIDSLTWMTPATKAKAKAKLGTLYVGVGYPEHWREYSGFQVLRDDPLGNAQRSDLFDYQWTLSKLSKPVDKTEWWLTPQTVNALNLPIQNGLNFPAAILNPPFFDPKADDVENYGSIGAVIGHEISHSFDDTGAQFDAYGRLLNWWTPQDLEHFRAAADRLAAQFDAYEPLPGTHVNGKLTLSENIADVAGLSAAYDAYRSAYAGKPSAKAAKPSANAAKLSANGGKPSENGAKASSSANGLSDDERFFIAFAQAWRGKMREEFQRVLLATDGHAPDQYRADTVRNLDAWYTAFNIQPGRKLYLAPDARVRVW